MSSRLKRVRKRKKIKNSISVYETSSKEDIDEFLNSKLDNESVDKVYKENADYYDMNVSEDEASAFLIKFKKDFNQERFDKLIMDCKKDVINSIVTPFGLGKIVAAYDQTGGNVTTKHNFEQGITATQEDKERYNEWQDSKNNSVDRTAHDEVKDQWKKDTYQAMENGTQIKDGYTGQNIGVKENGRINKDVSIHGEHITSVSEIEKDSSNHLYANGDDANTREKDRANLSGHDDNLTLIEGGMNSSKSDNDLKDWENSKVSKKHAKETGNEDMTNEEYYKTDKKLTDKAYKKSKDLIAKEQRTKQLKKQGKELLSTGASEGTKMGTQQALGLVITEFFTAVFDEILDIYRNGFSNNFNDDNGFFSILKERLKKISKRVAAKWKDAGVAFKDGFISGFISNLATTVINMFATTGKRVVRIIREGIFSLYKAIKMVLFPPKNMSYEDAIHEAKKLLATGLIISLGVIVEQYLDTLIKGTVILEPFSDILTTVFVGALTGLAITMTIYYLDKKKNDKDAVKLLMTQADEKFDNIEKMVNPARLVD